jgi:hypothetical protein
MWISQAAHEAGVNVQTLRYNERRGLSKIGQLRAMRLALTTLIDACHHGGAPTCPIIEALTGLESRGSRAR